MESLDIEECYDKEVATFLYGLDLSKYVGIFSKQCVDIDFFLELTDEDLCFIGVADSEDRKKLLNSINGFNLNKKEEDTIAQETSLNDREVLSIASNTLKQLNLLHAALAYTRLRLKATPVRNIIYGTYTSASVLKVLADEALSQNQILKSRLIGFEKSEFLPPRPTRYAVKRRLGWVVFTTSAICSVVAVFTLHFMRRSR